MYVKYLLDFSTKKKTKQEKKTKTKEIERKMNCKHHETTKLLPFS